ncbi:MAG: hypothetical protein LBM17_04915, partial [Candidatus Accumulibacter sp.]|nr:hypothetical protein [Accumulibacter sp.]
KSRYPSREEREKAGGQYAIDTRKGFGIVVLPEPVTINGRIWIRYIADDSYKRRYFYSTFLRPDRSLRVELSLPPYDYTRDPDPSTYPAMLKKAYANMEEMASSLRVVRIDDDGAPDPFVIERVEPAPLPVREKLPAAR